MRKVFLALLTVGLLLSASASAQITSGLVATYSLNEGTGTTITDTSGNGNTGTLTNTTWTASGKYGAALSFNGTSSYVDLANPASLQLTGSMTWSAWINATANPADDGQIIAKSDNTSGWQLKTSPDTGPHTFAIAVSNGTSRVQRNSTTVRSLNTWYHVAGVYNASTQTLDIYVNGLLDNGVLSGTVPSSQVNSAVNVNIGRRTGGFYFNGLIDEVRIYNRALSAGEIQTVMNTPISGATSGNSCDLNTDGSVNVSDLQLSVNMSLGLSPCTANIAGAGVCNVVVVQRVVNAALGGPCVTDTVVPPISLTSLTCALPTLTSGASTSCTVTLSQAAPSGGLSVALASNNPLVSLPASIVVTAGQTSASFTANVLTLILGATAQLTASLNGTSVFTTLTLVTSSTHSVTLSWTASISTVSGYNVYRSPSGGSFAKLNSSLVAGTSYTDSNVPTGTYVYVARAVDNTGTESINSNQAPAVVP